MTVTIDVDPERPDRIRVDAPFHMNDLIKSVPGSSFSRTSRAWTFPLSWAACLASRTIFGNDLVIGPDLATWARATRATVDKATALRTAMDADGDDDLYGYQRAGVEFLRTVERGFLFDEMGTGKTVTTIRTMTSLLRDGVDIFPALVVCPNTMKFTWRRELARWWNLSDPPRVTVINGTAAQRRKQFEQPTDIFVINWEGLRTHSRLAQYGSTALKRCRECGGADDSITVTQCQAHDKELNGINFQMVVGDEIHRVKSPKSQVSQALRAATGNAHWRFGLSGTPIANDASELWPLLHWADPTEWPTKTKWMDRYVDYVESIWGGWEILGLKPETMDEFHASIDYRTRRTLKAAALPFLPPIVIERRDVPFTGKQQKAYQAMSDDMAAALDSGVLMAASPMLKANRLTQLASSYGEVSTTIKGVNEQTGEDITSEHLLPIDPSNKLDAFMADLPDFEGQPMVVFADSRPLIELLSARLTKANIAHGLIIGTNTAEQNQQTMDSFQDGQYDIVLATIKAGGVGITLTRASLAVFLQRSWSPIEMDQARDRTHRIGSEQHDTITHIHYVTPGTVEEGQIWGLQHKRNLLQEIVQDEALLEQLLNNELQGELSHDSTVSV